jgi:hypothetical protein
MDCTVSPRRRKMRPNLGRVFVTTDAAVKMRRAAGGTFSLARTKTDRIGRPRSICVGPLEMPSNPSLQKQGLLEFYVFLFLHVFD